ncbi:MAG: hypothetical protein ACLTGI_12660 [Hoylesella buccalis]
MWTRPRALQHYRESTKHFQTSHTLLYKPLPQLTPLKAFLELTIGLNNNKEIVTNEYLIHIGEKHVGTTDAGRVNNFDRNYFGLTADINGQYKFYHANWLSNSVILPASNISTRMTARPSIAVPMCAMGPR